MHAAKTITTSDPRPEEIDGDLTHLLTFVVSAAKKAADKLGALEAEPAAARK